MSTQLQTTLPQALIDLFQGKSDQQKSAFEQLLKAGLPGKKNEEYRFTPISSSLENQLKSGVDQALGSLNTNSIPKIVGAFRITWNNGVLNTPEKLPTAIQIVQAKSSKQSDAFGLMNEAFRSSEWCIEITETTNQIIHLHHYSHSDTTSLAFPYLSVWVKSGVECTLIETFSHEGNGYHFSTPLLDMEVEEKAVVHYLRLQQCAGQWNQVYNSIIRQQANSLVHAFILTTDGAIVRNNFVLEINGQHAEGNLMGLYLLNGKTRVDNHTVVDHRVAECNSNELFKGVMQGQSKGVFNGKIFVRQDAQKTNAFQSNRNIVLSDTATIHTKPQLEIWADDVKCSHGCTTGQLDEEAVFYLESRGIDKPTAQAMLLDAFAGEVTEKIQSESLRAMVSELVVRKIASLR